MTAQLSFPPRENPTSVPSMTLPPHPGAQTGKGRGCFGASTLLVSLLPSQAVKGAGDSGGKLLGWPPVVGRPCSSYISYSLGIQGPGCSREKVLQWKGSGKVKRKRKDKREGGESQHDCLQPLLLLSTNLQPRRAIVWNDRGTPTPASFYHQTTLGLNCSRKGSPCHPVPSYPTSQAPDEQSRKADTGREHSLTPRPRDGLNASPAQTFTAL